MPPTKNASDPTAIASATCQPSASSRAGITSSKATATATPTCQPAIGRVAARSHLQTVINTKQGSQRFTKVRLGITSHSVDASTAVRSGSDQSSRHRYTIQRPQRAIRTTQTSTPAHNGTHTAQFHTLGSVQWSHHVRPQGNRRRIGSSSHRRARGPGVGPTQEARAVHPARRSAPL